MNVSLLKTLRLAGCILLAILSSPPLTPALAFGNAAEPLPVEQAFVPALGNTADDAIQVSFSVADGYYLYRDKLGFSLTDADGQTVQVLTPASLPDGILLTDDFFGDSITYRDELLVDLPLDPLRGTASTELAVSVKFQGCADIGLCYPPTTTVLPITLAAATPGTLNDLGGTALNTLRDIAAAGSSKTDQASDPMAVLPPELKAAGTLSDWLTGGSSPATNSSAARMADNRTDNEASNEAAQGVAQEAAPGAATALPFDNRDEEELLPPRQAFIPQLNALHADSITLDWLIQPGYYLYRDKLTFEIDSSGPSTIAGKTLPAGIIERDEFFGDVAVFRHNASIELAVSPALTDPDTRLLIHYQGCADIGVCFPPDTVSLPLPVSAKGNAPQVLAAATATPAAPNPPAGNADTPLLSEQDRLSLQLGTASLWLNALTFFAFGLLLTFTPCVLPMLPILSSLIVGQGDKVSTGKAFRLSLTYVLAMAITYTIVGVLIGLSGFNIQAWFQNPLILSAFAGLFVLLSLSMFGFYELQVPAGMQQRMMRWSNSQQGGQYGGVAVMGLLSALIVGPCVTAPLVGALIYIAETGDALIGGVALFSLSMGMGVPLLLVGTSAGRWLPKAGPWMDKTKAIFGIMLLAMAIWMLSRFLDPAITLVLAAVLAVLSGIYLGATDSLDRDSTGLQRIGKGAGLVVALYGVVLFVGAMSGSNSFLTPLRALTTSTGDQVAEAEHGLQFTRIKSLPELEATVAEAKARNATVMLDFYADWCVSCKEMEAFTFTDAAVQATLSDTVLIQADVTANDELDQALLRHLGLFGPPAIILYDRNGDEIRPARVVGFMGAERFAAHLNRFLAPSPVATAQVN